jgi:hypothetical protein
MPWKYSSSLDHCETKDLSVGDTHKECYMESLKFYLIKDAHCFANSLSAR